jgi:hypothetical protein
LKIVSAKQKSSLQVVESSTVKIMQVDVKCRGIVASKEVVGDVSNVICLNAPRAAHGVAQVTIHSQVASQGTEVVMVHNADKVMY